MQLIRRKDEIVFKMSINIYFVDIYMFLYNVQ